MIPFDFEYYKPRSADEALRLYTELDARGKNPMYYGGGTEIISFSRQYQLCPGAVIDLKGIPENNVLQTEGDRVVIGSAVTLSRIQESDVFPLLSRCAGRVADHTIRNKITLGGNICARIPYREAVLALLVGDSEFLVRGPDGERTARAGDIFKEVLCLGKAEFLVQVRIPRDITEAPFISLKSTGNGRVGYPQDRIGYPVVSAAGVKKDGRVRLALSGVRRFPFRSPAVEDVLNEPAFGLGERAEKAAEYLQDMIIGDLEASAVYRRFVLRKMITEIMEGLN